MSAHHLYSLRSSDPPPAGDGDTASWFYFYKWNVDGDRFLPKRPPHLVVEPGDFIWILLDEQLIGAVKVKSVYVEALQGTQEIWFDERVELDVPVNWSQEPGFLERFALQWLSKVQGTA